MIKLAALGAIGYAAYRYLQKSQAGSSRNAPEIALAGGPLSSHATLQHDPDLAPQQLRRQVMSGDPKEAKQELVENERDDELEKVQKEAAEEREEDGGYQ